MDKIYIKQTNYTIPSMAGLKSLHPTDEDDSQEPPQCFHNRYISQPPGDLYQQTLSEHGTIHYLLNTDMQRIVQQQSVSGIEEQYQDWSNAEKHVELTPKLVITKI